MTIVKLNWKITKTILIVFLISSLAFNIYSYKRYIDLISKYELLTSYTDHQALTSVIGFMTAKDIPSKGPLYIEIFDINKEKVIKKFKSNPSIQKEAVNYLKSLTGVYMKFNLFPKEGFMIKIPLESSVKIKEQDIYYLVNEVIIIFPGQDRPYLMFLDDEGRPHAFYFDGDTGQLLKHF
ncbi:MAG: hypothetical protein ACOYWZ_15970 [Bacillota bacterium]